MTKENRGSIDLSHSEIAFSVRYSMIARVKDTFKIFEASIYTTEVIFPLRRLIFGLMLPLSQRVTFKEMNTLKTNEFFDVKSHHQITFTARTMAKKGSDVNHELWGELTMIGITKNVKLDVQFGGISKDTYGNEKAGFSLTGKINCSDWGLTWNATLETGGFTVSDEVTISCEMELTNKGTKELSVELDPVESKQIIIKKGLVCRLWIFENTIA
jgi:polyisoprenoid-binding protein YceI